MNVANSSRTGGHSVDGKHNYTNLHDICPAGRFPINFKIKSIIRLFIAPQNTFCSMCWPLPPLSDCAHFHTTHNCMESVANVRNDKWRMRPASERGEWMETREKKQRLRSTAAPRTFSLNRWGTATGLHDWAFVWLNRNGNAVSFCTSGGDGAFGSLHPVKYDYMRVVNRTIGLREHCTALQFYIFLRLSDSEGTGWRVEETF